MKRMCKLSFALFLLCNFVLNANEKVSFDPVKSYLIESVEKGLVAGGSVLVYHKDRVVFKTGFGYADLASKKPFKVETPVIVASISKPIIGTTLLRLEELGKLNNRDTVSKYIPEFVNSKLEDGKALKRSPLLVELLAHTSGMRGDYDPEGRIWYQNWTKNRTMDYVAKKIALDIPFKAQPGTRWSYSGIGTDTAARVGEVASGLTRNQMLITHFSKALDMDNTFFRSDKLLKDFETQMPTRYYIHKENGKLTVNKGRTKPEIDKYSSSGGTVISTAPDLLKWLTMIKNEGKRKGENYLSPQIYQKLITPFRGSKNAEGGLFVRRKNKEGKVLALGHTGSSGTNIWIDFEKDLIGIMLTQTKGTDIKNFRLTLEKKINSLFGGL